MLIMVDDGEVMGISMHRYDNAGLVVDYVDDGRFVDFMRIDWWLSDGDHCFAWW